VPTAALTPPQALGLLSALSIDIHAAAVLDEHGALLAGSPDLGAWAASAGAASDGGRILARSARHTIAVAVGPRTMRGVLEIDLRTALDAMAGGG
jgi:hypothetical protein